MAALDDFARTLVIEQLRRSRTTALLAQRRQMESEVAAKANEFVNRRTLESMDRPTMDRLEALIDGGASVEQIQSFIAANVPNKDQLVANALIEFRNLYLGSSS